MKKFFQAVVASVLIASLSGCSLFADKTQTITINGQPAGAHVVVNGTPMTAPGTLNVKRNQHLSITVTKEGYNPFLINSGYTLSTTGILDLAGTFFFHFPALGFLSPGAFTLDQDNFYYTLVPLSE